MLAPKSRSKARKSIRTVGVGLKGGWQAKPWENRLIMEEATSTIAAASEAKTPPPKTLVNPLNFKDQTCPKSSELQIPSVRVRKNNMSTRISAKPPTFLGQGTLSSSSPSSEFRFDDSPASSSLCTSATPASGGEDMKPSYMNLTESTKAKRRRQRAQRQSMDEFQFAKKLVGFSNGDTKSSAGSDPPSVNFSRPLNLPTSRLERNPMRARERESYMCN